MQTHTPLNHAQAPTINDRSLLLEEVDFKWLMAGQGWWIDTARLHTDARYAAEMLDLVQATELPALKHCADQLRAQADTDVPHPW